MEKVSPDKIIKELRKLAAQSKPDFRQIMKLTGQLSKLDPAVQRFAVDAKTLIHLGRDSIKDHTTALLELVKNSYDADAFNVDVEILCTNKNDQIRVSDNGFGMTREELLNYWLRIGFSNKRKSKTSEMGRRKTGEKGIGRISTDRLGGMLELISKTKSDGFVGLKVNWDDFDIEGRDVFDIEVEMTKPTSINIPLKQGQESLSGTEIKITNLRQTWSKQNIENLYFDLTSLTPPFEKVQDFNIELVNDIAPEFSAKVITNFYKAAQVEVTVIYDGTDEIFYSIKDKNIKKESVETITVQQFYSKDNKDEGKTKAPRITCGPLEVKLLFFLRQGSSVLGTKFKLGDLREFLDNNNGVKIYRDFIAVKPYGFQKAQLGYDWLGLGDRKARNPAGLGRGDEYSVSANQLVGAVFIGRDTNLKLLDSAAREGLIESEEFYDMKELVLASIRLLETHRANTYEQSENESPDKGRKSGSKEAEKIIDQLSSVKYDLNEIKDELETADQPVRPAAFLKPITRTIGKVQDITEEVTVTFNDLLNWQRVVNGLATIGISSAVFGHETEDSITQFQGSTSTALKLLRGKAPNIDSILSELDKAFRHSKKVAAWGAYALSRVQKEKRAKRKTPILGAIQNVVNELTPAFHASTIELRATGDRFYVRTFQMDIESILVNLLTNAYTAAKQNAGDRAVIVETKLEDLNSQAGFSISVADTGPGVAKEFEKQIFDPLFSTKTVGVNESKSVGTGLGLTIVKSIVEDLNGQIFITRDKSLKGANFKIWLPK